MCDSTRHALERAADLIRHNRLVEAMATADEFESAEIRQWPIDHADDFTGEF
ncbi:hypothetical protein MHW47_07730 [Streptomyces sp. OfavH-34-F]|uniref:hypothetical protein n=1 Tax=Streptomyces sp. OfavH-34-F TaxID=2917760 RepID=UPI001EF362EB|nr:hypothetical protein [Streptomyces sp. OfavH-34-F]MCG7524329.1 hypothetical protein [Streptomyces sp. OfavH-34-F]